MANNKRLIDPERCYCIAKTYHSDFEQNLANLHSLRELLDDCPAVDAVEVVRCKKCKWSRTNANDHEDVYYCKLRTGRAYHSGDFCSYGERREGE